MVFSSVQAEGGCGVVWCDMVGGEVGSSSVAEDDSSQDPLWC